MLRSIKKIIYVVTPCVASVLVVSQIILSNELAGARSVIASLDSEISALSEEGDFLSAQVASASALSTIGQKALSSGFVAASKSNIIALDDSYSVAQAPADTSVQ